MPPLYNSIRNAHAILIANSVSHRSAFIRRQANPEKPDVRFSNRDNVVYIHTSRSCLWNSFFKTNASHLDIIIPEVSRFPPTYTCTFHNRTFYITKSHFQDVLLSCQEADGGYRSEFRVPGDIRKAPRRFWRSPDMLDGDDVSAASCHFLAGFLRKRARHGCRGVVNRNADSSASAGFTHSTTLDAHICNTKDPAFLSAQVKCHRNKHVHGARWRHDTRCGRRRRGRK